MDKLSKLYIQLVLPRLQMIVEHFLWPYGLLLLIGSAIILKNITLL